MDNVSRWVRTAARSRDRRQQGMLLSAARAWLFNEALSSVVEAGRWNSIGTGQTVLLDGTASFFTAELGSDDAFELRERLKTGDVHPGLPLFGKPPAENAARAQFTSCYSTLADHYADLAEGLERSGLKTEWRASRCLPRSLCAAVEGDVLTIKFELPKGQFATTVLRELVLADGV